MSTYIKNNIASNSKISKRHRTYLGLYLFIYSLFTDAFSVTYNIASNDRVIGEWWIGNDVEGSGIDLI
jgi:hypothetical protein